MDCLVGFGDMNFTQQFLIGLVIAILIGLIIKMNNSGPWLR